MGAVDQAEEFDERRKRKAKGGAESSSITVF
jgi:hypothetical protein